MTPPVQQRIVLARVPEGVPVEEDFRSVEAPVPSPIDGQFLARTIYLSLDPYLRSAIAGRHLGHRASAIGDLVPGRSVGQVVASRHAGYREGTYVLLETGWQQYAVSDGRGVRALDPAAAPLSTALGVLGMPGLTAWAGVVELARARPGETFLVSAPVGPVGSTAAQIARIAGCRIVGITSTDEKRRLAIDTFRFDTCLTYSSDAWRDELARATAPGVDIYFDNAGGPVLQAAMNALAPRGRVVLCGLIEQYNTGVPAMLPVATVIRKRAHMLGLVVYDFEDRFETFLAHATSWLAEGRLRYLEDRVAGLAAAPGAFHRLMSGRNLGKSIVVISAESHDA